MIRRVPLLALVFAAFALPPVSWSETPTGAPPDEACQSCNARHAAMKKLQELREQAEPVLLPETEETAATNDTDD